MYVTYVQPQPRRPRQLQPCKCRYCPSRRMCLIYPGRWTKGCYFPCEGSNTEGSPILSLPKHWYLRGPVVSQPLRTLTWMLSFRIWTHVLLWRTRLRSVGTAYVQIQMHCSRHIFVILCFISHISITYFNTPRCTLLTWSKAAVSTRRPVWMIAIVFATF